MEKKTCWTAYFHELILIHEMVLMLLIVELKPHQARNHHVVAVFRMQSV